jgi:hypothetical protein
MRLLGSQLNGPANSYGCNSLDDSAQDISLCYDVFSTLSHPDGGTKRNGRGAVWGECRRLGLIAGRFDRLKEIFFPAVAKRADCGV